MTNTACRKGFAIGVDFVGLKGRDRKIKRHFTDPVFAVEVPPEAELRAFAERVLVKIGARKGRASVRIYPNAEESVYLCDNGRIATTIAYPITAGQPSISFDVGGAS